MKLHDIVKEIDRMGRLYRNSESSEAKKTYSQYVELIISDESEKSQQYNLNDYWSRLTR